MNCIFFRILAHYIKRNNFSYNACHTAIFHNSFSEINYANPLFRYVTFWMYKALWCTTACGCHHFGLTFIKRLENMFWVVGTRPGKECIVPRKWDQNYEKSHIVGGKFSLHFFLFLTHHSLFFLFFTDIWKKLWWACIYPMGLNFLHM